MKRVLPYVVTLSLGLWAGGLVALILFVSTLFTKARLVAIDAAPVLFDAFEKYQIVLAVIALVAVTLWRFMAPTKIKTTIVAAVTLATVLAFVQIAYITPTIERARTADRPTFDRFHALAGWNYTTISVLVIASLGLSVAVRPQASSPGRT